MNVPLLYSFKTLEQNSILPVRVYRPKDHNLPKVSNIFNNYGYWSAGCKDIESFLERELKEGRGPTSENLDQRPWQWERAVLSYKQLETTPF